MARRSFCLVAAGVLAVACSSSPSSSSGGAPTDPPSAPPGSANDPPFDVPSCVLAEGTPSAGDVVDATGRATAAVVAGDGCARTFSIASDAERRDANPASPRTVAERAERASLQSGNTMFDALYQLAIAELDEASVSSIRDGAFRNGEPLACPSGCFETGRKWPYVWTRDTSYASHLGLGWFDPTRARGSLELKTSTRRDGTDLQIVQDTGTGGSYPVSTDRVTWALGARAILQHLAGDERDAFAALAHKAIVNTLAHDRAVVFDGDDGLYRGEQSFLDWRSQSYPAWTVPDTVAIATSKSLSTNVAHLAAMEAAVELGEASLQDEADALRKRIRTRFWLDEDQALSSFIPTELDPAPVHRFDLLATSLAVLLDVTTPEEGRAAVARYPVLKAGPPVIFPQQQDTAIYHNRAIWPFVTAYFTAAARKVGNGRAASLGVMSLVRGAALNLSNVENLELATGKPWVEEGPTSGPVVNSQRQLWSVAGYLQAVHGVLFGLTPVPGGLEVAPFVPRALRADLFGGAQAIALNDVPLRGKRVTVVLRLPAASDSRDGAYAIRKVTLNGKPVTGSRLADDKLAARNLVEIDLRDDPPAQPDEVRLLDPSDYRTIFGPRTPSVTGVSLQNAAIAVGLDRGAEEADAVRLDVYRDGVRVAKDLPGGTTKWIDVNGAGKSHCYTVESRFVASGTTSQRARPACFWGASGERIQTIGANAFDATGGSTQTADRPYRGFWGDPGHTITATFTAQRTGQHLAQVVYGNGQGPIDTGITCAVKRVDVRDAATDASAGAGYAVMPQRGEWRSWGDSSTVRASLVAGRTYRVVLSHDDRAVNMSAFQHFADYTGGAGGKSGETYRVDVAAVKVLALEP